ncbi:MAG TPA: PAS domain S-box protein [Candidatus Angelobacter sp.]|nr:PAS domain S-box protein [Candidatus Angelobacter sp.]
MSAEVAAISSKLLTAIVESSDDAIISTTLDGLVTFWSPAAERMFGYSATEMIGHPLVTIMPPPLVDKERALMSRIAENGRVVRNKSIRVSKGGQQLKVAATFSPVRDGAGTIVEILSIAHEVIEMQRGDLVQRESEERFRVMSDSTPVMIKSAGVDGELNFVNKAFLKFTGRGMDETLGIGWAEDIHPEDLQGCFEFRTTAFCERRLFQHKYRLRRHDGEYRWIVDTDVPRFDTDGKFIGYIGSNVDITDRKHAEELEARVHERTRIARELHDTLLQSFHGLLLRFQTASSLLPSHPEEAREILEKAINAAAQAVTEGRDAVQALRSSTAEANDLAVSIKMLGEELTAGESHSISPAFRVEVEGEPRNLNAVRRDEVYRIAAEALGNAFRHAQARNIEVEIRYEEQQFRLRIRDDGKGIDPEVLRVGRREGHFGLHGMKERAQIADGKLEIWSRDGAGTEIELAIPAASAYTAVRPSAQFAQNFFSTATDVQ